MDIYGIPSPAVYVDMDIFKKNCVTIREKADKSGKKIRAHFKAHRSVFLAKIQKEMGMDGFVAAKLGEAEVLAEAGLNDILIAFPLYGKEKWERYAFLNQKADISATVDSIPAVRGLSEACAKSGKKAKVFIEVDVGSCRCGVQPEEIKRFAEEIRDYSGIEIVGLFDYNSKMYGLRTAGERKREAEREKEILSYCLSQMDALGMDQMYVSSGNSPAVSVMDHYEVSDEIRVGNAFFHDVSSLDANLCETQDCALRVMATVVSRPKEGHATIDAGSKTLTTDRAAISEGYGKIISPEDIQLVQLNEEHGYLCFQPDKVNLEIGERIVMIPNHACVIHNLQNSVYAVSGENVIMKYLVDARGLSY